MVCLFLIIDKFSSINPSPFLWGRESVVLNRYHNYSLTILCDYSEFISVYSMIEMFILQLSFGRFYGRYLIPR